ncbi:MAG: hypothetical protein HY271_14560 [Deltaproteobacteria bacterium]|nr:hypothetical protein [Deltaproteobacteria bacterium]
MSWLTVTLALYRRTLTRAAELTLRNWPVSGSLFVYALAMSAALALAPLLGIFGGFLLSLIWAACVGSLLYLVEMMVRTSRVTLEDFRRSAGKYVWDVVGVTFVVWIAFRLLTPVLATIPQGPILLLAVNLVILVFFNAVPELIYLGHCSSFELLGQSYVFIGENWIEWFPVTLTLGGLVLCVAALPVTPGLAWLKFALVALLVAYTMVVRGLLFLELHDSTRRSRAFRHRMGG